MKVLVTGGAGFLGSHIVEMLLAKGHTVRVLDRMRPGKVRHLIDEIGFVCGDLRKLEDCREAVQDVDAIIHLAALINVDHSRREPLEFYETNVRGTMNLLEAARVEPSVKKLVYMSTAEVYGSSEGILKETALCDTRSPYAASKYAGERYCLSYYYTYGEPEITIIRGFNMYGPRQSYGSKGAVIAIFTTLALMGKPPVVFGSGEQCRDYVYVKDTARGVIEATLTEGLGGEIINLASGKTVTVNEIVKAVLEITGSKHEIEHAPARPGELWKSRGDADKARRLLGWVPTVGFREGLQATVEYFRNSEE